MITRTSRNGTVSAVMYIARRLAGLQDMLYKGEDTGHVCKVHSDCPLRLYRMSLQQSKLLDVLSLVCKGEVEPLAAHAVH